VMSLKVDFITGKEYSRKWGGEANSMTAYIMNNSSHCVLHGCYISNIKIIMNCKDIKKVRFFY
jgi:hypothetical protein